MFSIAKTQARFMRLMRSAPSPRARLFASAPPADAARKSAKISSTMKRGASATKSPPKTKKPRPTVPAYVLTPSLKDESGNIIWPAPKDQIEEARKFILECAKAQKKTLIVPDKDVDGLTSGAILLKTLTLLGLNPELIHTHLLQKSHNIHDESERAAMAAHEPSYIFILDQGSRKAPPLIDAPHKGLVIDHHFALDDEFPEGSQHVTACHYPPVATSSLLTYHLCSALHEDVHTTCDWLCAMGTHGDLGNSLKWDPPFPNMENTFKKYTKKAVNEAISLLNAPRRTAAFSVPIAWEALTNATCPKDVLKSQELKDARAEVNAEVDRCARAPPKFSADSRIAVFRIESTAQIHPVIATRWAGVLSSPKLEVILVANEGYLSGMVNFSCRVPRSARSREPPVNIIEVLRDIANQAPDPTLHARLGESFARGHKEASGGIVPVDEFEELMACLEIGKKSEDKAPKTKSKTKASEQSNTLMNYFGKDKEEGKTKSAS